MKVCGRCKRNKKNVDFEGENKACKECSECQKRYRQKNHEKIKQSNKQYRQKNSEKIKRYNKQYHKQYGKKYRQKNSEKIKQYNKQYRQKNPEKAKQYYQNNKERFNKSYAIYIRKKYREDSQYRIKNILRGRLYKALTASKAKKSISHVKDLGCSIDFLREHLEMQFYPHPVTGEMMTWGSWGKGRGKWQIDHIKEFQEIDVNDREQLLSVVHFSNLQPLWTVDHVKKTAARFQKNT